MHPRSAADILASVKPAPKRSRKPAKINLTPDSPDFLWLPLENTTQSTLKFISASIPNTVSTERGEEGVEDIANSGHFEEFNSMSALPMFI